MWLLSSFFLSVFFFLLLLFIFFLLLIIIFYFNNFILFYFIFFFLSFFFSPFYSERVDDRVFVLRLGIRAVSLRLESQVQDIGPPETSQLHIISNGENHPEISISTPRPSSTQPPASYSAGHPMTNN